MLNKLGTIGQGMISHHPMTITKQESISNEDEDSLCGRVNHLSASGSTSSSNNNNSWNRTELSNSQSFSRHQKV